MSKKVELLKKIKKQLNDDLNKFKNFSETDFYIKNLENIPIIERIESFLKTGFGDSLLILGEKGSGKSYLLKWLLKDNNDFLYIDLINFQKNIFYLFKKQEDFLNFFNNWEIILFDNFECLDSKTKIYRKIKLLKEEREKNKKINIFLEVWKNNLFEYKNSLFKKKNIIFLNIPNDDFLIKIIKNLFQKNLDELKITESSISFLSLYFGKNLKIFINKLFKLIFFLKCCNYNLDILDINHLKKILNELFSSKEKRELIDYKNNSQLEIICKKKNFDLRKIKSNLKNSKIVFERDQVIYILREKLNFSIKDIAKILFKSKSGIIYSLKKIYKKRKSDYFREYFDYLISI